MVVYGSIVGNDYILAASYSGVVILSLASCIINSRAKNNQ